jgi:hypothetical protein
MTWDKVVNPSAMGVWTFRLLIIREDGICHFRATHRGDLHRTIRFSTIVLRAWLLNCPPLSRILLFGLRERGHPNLTQTSALGPISAVFLIIHCDTMDFLQFVESFVDNVHGLAEDEFSLQRNIAIWRRLINVLGAKLRALTKSISPFTDYLCGPTSNKGKTRDQHSIRDSSENLLEEILRIQKRLDKLFHVLVSSLSIVESRRSIAEAESVTKLTELGKLRCPQN